MLTLTLFTVFTRCLGFIYKIYLTKVMTTTELGIYNISLSIFMVLLTIVGSSIPLTISKLTAKNISTGKENNTSYSVTSALILNILITAFLSLLSLISKPLLSLVIGDSIGYTIIVALLPSVLFTAVYSQIKGYLWGIENYFAVSIVEFIEQIIKILLVIVFVHSSLYSNPLIAITNAMNISCGISTVYGIILYLKNQGRFKYKKGYFKDIIVSSTPLTCIRLLSSLLGPIVSIIIPLRLSTIISRTEALGTIGILTGMSMPLLSIPSTIIGALCMILVPRVSSEDKSSINNQINYYIIFTISCVFLFIPSFLVLGVPVCELIFNNTEAGIFLSNYSWVMLPIGISQITTAILNALNQETKTFIYFIISNVIMILFTLIFTPLIGAGILALGLGISSSITSYLNIIKIKKLLATKTSIIKTTIYHILLSLPSIMLTKYTYQILNRYVHSILAISISGIVSVISLLCLLFAFNIISIPTIKSYLARNKIKRASN